MSAMLVVGGVWLWLGLVPLLVLGERGQRPAPCSGSSPPGRSGWSSGCDTAPPDPSTGSPRPTRRSRCALPDGGERAELECVRRRSGRLIWTLPNAPGAMCGVHFGSGRRISLGDR